MSIDQNLMGLGLPAALAARIASAGTGPVSVTAKGTSFATGQNLGGKQFVVFVSAGVPGWVNLPVIGGDFGPEIGDDFVIHNGVSGQVLTVGVPAGVTVNLSGTAGITGSFTLAAAQTATMWVQSSTQWFGIRN